MRKWGRVPIYKASRPNHELGIHTHTTLLRKPRKEVILGTKEDRKDNRVEKNISRREERRFFDSGIERKTENQARFLL
jgi:hypothetical protein